MLQLVITLCIIFVSFYLINKLRFYKPDGINILWVNGAFLLKILASFLAVFIYSHFYTIRSQADIFKYFDDARIFYQGFHEAPWSYFRFFLLGGQMPESLTAILPQTLHWDSSFDNALYGNGRILIRIHALILPISQGGFASHIVIFCLLSFTGLVGIYRFFEKAVQIPEKWLFGIIFLLPSVLFWSSAMTKETLVFFFTGLFLFFFEKVSQNGRKLVLYPLILLIVFLLIQTRLALMLLILPALFAWLLKQRLPALKTTWVYLLTYFVFAVVMVLLNNIQHVDIPGIIASKQKGFVLVAVHNQVQYYTAAPMLTGSWLSLVVSLPAGFLQALIHPHLVEAGHLFIKLSALENVFVLCLGALALLHLRKEARNENITWFLLMLILTGFSFNGLICPVTGALVRYKSMFLLFLVLFFVHIFDVEKFKVRFGLKN